MYSVLRIILLINLAVTATALLVCEPTTEAPLLFALVLIVTKILAVIGYWIVYALIREWSDDPIISRVANLISEE